MEWKFTPGTWRVHGDKITVGAGRAHICRALDVYMDRKQREANAQLIAAAPDLLVALSATGFDQLDCQEPDKCGTGWGVCAPCMAEQAIAKAVGLDKAQSP